MKYKFKINYKKLLADTVTPVSIYLKIRDQYANSILMESSDYHGNENSFSYICFNPIASIRVEDNITTAVFPDGQILKSAITNQLSASEALRNFADKFETNDFPFLNGSKASNFNTSGMFGYIAYDAVKYFEDIHLKNQKKESKSIPDIIYSIYQYSIVINHFNDEMMITENLFDDEKDSALPEIEALIYNKNFASYHFKTIHDEQSSLTDEEFLYMVQQGKKHCHRGDVFQVVLSREFSQSFQGDEFNVYRALRTVNPSPYLFYFDYGSFKILGSSPEAQLTVKNGMASIHPIAGTFRRTGNEINDAELAKKLKTDTKENAEHIMLVDLARNDLSKNCSAVKVETLREIQYYSHVIHLVSKVTGKMNDAGETLNIVAATFPAGTLSGAPKHRAMQLIDVYEKNNRGFYGGCIGFMGFNGSFNHAIIIRSFLSKNNLLFYQAGAGIVDSSNEHMELQEVNNKLAALKKAIDLAQLL
ncbi:MAG: anthranilate synthase component I family protein [Chitinophagales bacterium]|nr:anthranilate synthase component I family protein [Chitinophagales bacterium]